VCPGLDVVLGSIVTLGSVVPWAPVVPWAKALGDLRGYVYTVGVRNSLTTKTAAVAVVAFFGLGLAACSKDAAVDTTAAAETAAIDTTIAAAAETTAAAVTETTAAVAAETTAAAAAETVAAAATTGSAMSADCAKDKLTLVTAGKLTVGTDSPAYGPWFSDDTPSNQVWPSPLPPSLASRQPMSRGR
jgi:hypothetical protein